ncbi:MAG: amino acid adenylation domain-containing protein [Caldilineaceae bacterium]|nr:amino acid adenylation domain-containing protein [Caldilineaceae bacterium]
MTGADMAVADMTIAELFAHLHRLDVQLWVDGDRLRLNAPQGVLTPELSAELVKRKAELILFLKRARSAADAPTLPLKPAPRDQELPLSFAQQRLWFLNQMESGNIAYNLASSIQLRGVVNRPALEQAMNAVIQRHEILRTTFGVAGGEPVQRIAPAEARTLPVVDLSHLPKREREREVEQLTQAASHTPFHLAEGPLFALTLICLDTAESLLLLRMHHIIADGVSVEVLLHELGTFYEAFVRGERVSLSALPIQYADFAYWQRQWLQGSVLANQLAYWQKQLSGPLPVLELIPDHPRPAVQTFHGAKLPLLLPVSLSQAIKRLCHDEDVTLFMLMLAAFKALLFRYTGQTDLIVGSPLAGRARVETQGLIGCFINILPFRTDLSGDPTFRELLKRVREVATGAYAHQDIPFEKLVESVSHERDVSRSPLFQVMFLQHTPMRARHIGDLSLTPALVDNGAAMFELTMNLLEAGDQLALLLEYNTDLFDAATMQRLLGHFQVLLEGIVAEPDQRIAQLPLLPEAERRQLLVEWNQTAADYPRRHCLHHLFEAQVERSPQVIALVCGREALTYQALNQRANHLAHYLQRLGVGPGSLVAICTDRSAEMLVGLLGILKTGAAYLPLDPTYPKERLAFMLEDAAVAFLLTQEPLLDELPQSAAHAICLDRDWATIAADSSTENPASGAAPETLAYVIYTSGSTGKPKGVQLPHRSVVNFLTSMQQRPGLTGGDTLLAVTTLSFDIAVLELFLPLTVGAKVVIASREVAADGSQLAQLLSDSQATVMQATPVTWRLLLESGWTGNPTLKVLCGGEALPRDLADRLLDQCASLWNMYGPTETTVWSMVYPVGPGVGPVPVGRPIANTQIYILDDQNQPVPIGVPGHLYIGGDGLAAGYLKRPELTAERFVPSLFDPSRLIYKTGDIARYLPDGNIEFLGRADHQVKVRGFRIELGEIEAQLVRHPTVRQAAVIVREDEPGDKRLVAYIVPEEDRSLAPDELRRALKEHLPDYMIPTAFVSLERLPLTPNNKVDRRALPAPESARPDLDTGFVAPQTEIEQLLATLWQETLKLDQVGVHDNFFDLGGHSLLLTQLHSKLKERLGSAVSIIKLFQYPTISTFATYLVGIGESTPLQPAPRPKRRPASMLHARGDERIAIIGLAGRFPQAKDISAFWQNLCDGVEGISFFSDEELRQDGADPALLRQPNFVNAKATLEDIELFDAAFFGLNPREAELIDPQHRLFLECAWAALESAGYDPETYQAPIGVFAGSTMNTYLMTNLVSNLGGLDAAGGYQVFVGNDKDFLPTRVSYKLNLRGPSVNIQTACSSSLVAVHQACQSLLRDECSMALAGGVSVSVPHKMGYLYQEGMILSPDGHCRAFDAGAKGTVSGEGVGIVVLKRLGDALADGDQIRAVIRGSAINNDGSLKIGYTAPSVEGQAEVIAMAQAAAEVEPESISYVEAHGTGTPLGDPIEIAALTQVFRAGTPHKGFCAIGSVKSNIGHLDAAAGVTGLIKTVLALQHKQIPPSLHFEKPNPEIDFENSPFYVNNRLADWQANGTPRRAGVSSFGIGGTNAHVVLEEAPEVLPKADARPWQALVLSARTATALEAATMNLVDHLKANPAVDLEAVAFTLQVGRRHFAHRRTLAVSDVDDAIGMLQKLDPNRVFTQVRDERDSHDPALVFMFPGQGAQYVEMGRGLYDAEPLFRREVDRCAELLQPALGLDLRQLLYPESDQLEASSEALRQTAITQPALFVIEYALAQLWISWGVRPKALIGHSIGEYVAACLAGVFSLGEALQLVAARGRLMQQLPRGEMLAVALPEQALLPLLNGDDVALAAVNASSLCVVSGPVEAIETLQRKLSDRQVECRLLHTSHAFHSPMMAPALEPFAQELAKISLHAPQIAFVSNVTGQWITPAEATDPNYWLKHTRQAVRFAEGLQTMLASEPKTILLEVGPGHSLSQLARQQPESPALAILASLRHPRSQQPDMALLMTTLGRLWLAGVQVDWRALYGEAQPRRVELPTYPFERQRYWIERDPNRPLANQAAQRMHRQADLADWFYAPSWQRAPLPAPASQAPLAEQRMTWLIFRDPSALGTELIQQLTAQGQEVISVEVGKRFREMDSHSYRIDPHNPADYDALFDALVRHEQSPDRLIHLWSVGSARKPQSPLRWDEEAQIMGFYSLLYLVQAFNRQEMNKPLDLFVLSSGLYDVRGDEELDPAHGTLPGICRVIPQEYPDIRCRVIDVVLPKARGAAMQQLGQQLLAEMTATSVDPTVAYRGEYRWVEAFAPLQLPSPAQSHIALREQGVYLITGGLGDIAFAIGAFLAQAVKARLLLTGRTVLPPRSEWETWLAAHRDNDSVSGRIRKVQALEEMGAEVLLAGADVADERQMAAVVAEAYSRFGALHGVIHAAGTVEMTLLSSLDHDVCAQQFNAKCQGLLVLAKVLQGKPLDFCFVTSSLSTTLGGLGYAAYAAANAYMDAFVQWHNQQHKQGNHQKSAGAWTLVNWDAWQSAGAASQQDEQANGLAGFAMTPAEGVETFRRILAAAPGSQVIVSTGDLGARFDHWVRRDATQEKSAQAETPQAAQIARVNRQAYVAPRNEREEALAGIWREILGMQEIGVHENFFDLGGSSLVAVRLFDKIERKFSAKLPLATLFDAQTIAQLAELLEDVAVPEEENKQASPHDAERRERKVINGWSPLVAIQPNGSRPPLFCVHAAGGNVVLYRDMARHLDADQPIYGLQAQGLDGRAPVLESVEEMASLYVRHVKTLQPHGPYFLAGYCMGGSVALEMAQQLRAQGDKVALVAMFETYNWRNMKIDARFATSYFVMQKILFHARNFMLLDTVEKKIFLNEKFKVLQDRRDVIAGSLLMRFGRRGAQSVEADDSLLPAKVWKTNDQAAMDYQPRLYPGKITHFRPMKEYAIHRGPELGWDTLAAEVETHWVRAYPAGMFVEPFVASLAELIQACIDQAKSETALTGEAVQGDDQHTQSHLLQVQTADSAPRPSLAA